MSNLFVLAGAFFGTMARYLIYLKIGSHFRGTFLVNTLGAFLFGAVVGYGSHGSLYIFLADGFLGSFTTFSALVWETENTMYKSKEWDSILYIIFSVVVGIFSFIMARFLFGKI